MFGFVRFVLFVCLVGAPLFEVRLICRTIKLGRVEPWAGIYLAAAVWVSEDPVAALSTVGRKASRL